MAEDSEIGSLATAGVAHVIVDDLDSPEFSSADEHHLLNVRRLRTGEKITVGDGRGLWRSATIRNASGERHSRKFTIESTSEIRQERRLLPPISIGFVVPSMDRATWAIQKMTELGVDKICLIHSRFASARREGLSPEGKEFQKLSKVVRESAMQSRAAFVPALLPIVDIADFAGTNPMSGMCTVGGEGPLMLGFPVIVGPEGGFSREEEELFVPKLGLGRQVLRSETAAVCVASVLSMQRQGLISCPSTGVDNAGSGQLQ